MLLIPLASFMLVECFTHTPMELKYPVLLANFVFYLFVYRFLFCLCGNVWCGYSLGTILFFLMGLLNFAVVEFRSSPVMPWDLFSVKTAVSVAGNYTLTLTPALGRILSGFIVLLFLGTRIGSEIKGPKIRLSGTLICFLLLAVYVKGIGTEKAIKTIGLDDTLYTPNAMYQKDGLMAGFFSNIKYLRVQKPSGYSKEEVNRLTNAYQTEHTYRISEDSPNIIVIMNEAFSDLSVYGEFVASEDELEFIHSMDEHTVKGNCYVSVKGGNTPNSEYEFLTGNSMAFLPTGSVPYQQYIKEQIPSLASYLGGLGYRSIAIHPFRSEGWCRDQVYPRIGFDERVFMDQFEGAPALRHFVTDQAAFDKIIEYYEGKEKGEKLFVFEVTMQNHGGYNKKSDDFKAKIKLTGLTEKTKQVKAAQNYLTLIQKTDEAFQSLVEYFEKQKEPTIILMYGDHQPADLVTDVFAGFHDLSEEEKEKRSYIVPYIIWSNMKIDETAAEKISLNYLSGMLLEKAGIPLTGYQMFLKKYQEEFPVITAKTIMTDDGQEQKPAAELVDEYDILSYNLLCGGKDRMWEFFGGKGE